MDLMISQWAQIHENFHTPTISRDFRTSSVFFILELRKLYTLSFSWKWILKCNFGYSQDQKFALKIVVVWDFKFTNLSCRFLNPNPFFQFEF